MGFSKQAYYKWLKKPVSDREVEEAHLIGVPHELHADDRESGYRVLADAHLASKATSDNKAVRGTRRESKG